MSPQSKSPDTSVPSHVCVVGAGTMGRGIAQVALAHGHQVSLVDPAPAQLDAAFADIKARLSKRQPHLAEALAAHLQLATSIGEAPRHRETIVIEAVLESLAVKGQVFMDALDHFGPTCVLATNTSSLSITAIAAQVRASQQVVGMHFFNPVPVMKLVEVVSGLQTDPAVSDRIVALAQSWDKQVVRVRSAPGFIVNRVARPFYGEALKLLEEGVAPAHLLDALMRRTGGFRMGPFELMDLIGNDVNFTVTQTVWSAFRFDPRFAPSQVQAEVVAAGRFGRKTGSGFYSYASDATTPLPTPADPSPHGHRLDLTVHGCPGPLHELVARAGLDPAPDDTRGTGPETIDLGEQGLILLTRGRTAQDEELEAGRPVAVVDRCLDGSTATALAVAATDASLLSTVACLAARADVEIFPVADTPGLVVARVVAMIINEAADAVLHQVASPGDVDLAMELGTNYPKGPFAWADQWSWPSVLEILDNVWAEYHDPRYRASQWLRARARAAVA